MRNSAAYSAAYRAAWLAKRERGFNAKYQRERKVRIRAEIIRAYGGRCVCCGESEPAFLTVDHINGGGTVHKKSLGGNEQFYPWLRRNNFPKDKFQLLCWNCNLAKARLGKCPHKEEK